MESAIALSVSRVRSTSSFWPIGDGPRSGTNNETTSDFHGITADFLGLRMEVLVIFTILPQIF